MWKHIAFANAEAGLIEPKQKASNRALADMFGVDETRLRRELGMRAANAAPAQSKAAENKAPKEVGAANAAPAVSGADAAKLAKKQTEKKAKKAAKKAEREAMLPAGRHRRQDRRKALRVMAKPA